MLTRNVNTYLMQNDGWLTLYIFNFFPLSGWQIDLGEWSIKTTREGRKGKRHWGQSTPRLGHFVLAGKQERDVSYARRAPEPSSCTEQGTPSFHNCGKERDTRVSRLGHFVVGGKQEGDTSNSRRRCDFHGANTQSKYKYKYVYTRSHCIGWKTGRRCRQ